MLARGVKTQSQKSIGIWVADICECHEDCVDEERQA
jgi:hypothetical protein